MTLNNLKKKKKKISNIELLTYEQKFIFELRTSFGNRRTAYNLAQI